MTVVDGAVHTSPGLSMTPVRLRQRWICSDISVATSLQHRGRAASSSLVTCTSSRISLLLADRATASTFEATDFWTKLFPQHLEGYHEDRLHCYHCRSIDNMDRGYRPRYDASFDLHHLHYPQLLNGHEYRKKSTELR